MARVIDPTSDRPLRRQLADVLRGKVETGEVASGQFLPSEGQLAQTYNVGRDTARAALALLRSEGLAVTVPRLGTYVRGGHDVDVVTIDTDARVSARMPTDEERRELHISEGTPLLVIVSHDREDRHPADRTVIHFES